jgi:hypothetical protein
MITETIGRSSRYGLRMALVIASVVVAINVQAATPNLGDDPTTFASRLTALFNAATHHFSMR